MKVVALLALLRPSSALQKPGAAGGWGQVTPAAAPASPETPFIDPEIAAKLDGVWQDIELTNDQELLLASTDFWCDAEEPTPECVDEEEFLNGGVPIFAAEEDPEDDPWCDVTEELPSDDCIDLQEFNAVETEPDWGSVDSHEAVPLINGKPEREAFSFVDERSCVGCNLCAAIAPATFYMEEEHGMARIYRQHGDAPEVIEEAKAACPVGCIKDINFDGLVKAEQERRTQAINNAGRLTQRAEGKAPRTILEGLVDTDDPEYQAREKARELERIREGLKTLAGSRRRLVEL
jgi:ferredoxin